MTKHEHGMSDADIAQCQARYGKGPHLAADLVVLSLRVVGQEVDLVVLLIQRKHPPYAGYFAFPGGFVEPHEDLREGALRELAEETTLTELDRAIVQQLAAYGRPQRDPRSRVVSTVFTALVPWSCLGNPQGGDDAADARFFRLRGARAMDDAGQPLAMAFDHAEALEHVRERLVQCARYSSTPLCLLNAPFTTKQARQAYELFLDESVDEEALCRWLQAQGWIAPQGSGWRMPHERPEWMLPGWLK